MDWIKLAQDRKTRKTQTLSFRLRKSSEFPDQQNNYQLLEEDPVPRSYKRRCFFVQFDPPLSRFLSFTNKIKSLTVQWGSEPLLLFVLIHGSLVDATPWNNGEDFRLVTNSCSPGQTSSVCPTDFFLSLLPWRRRARRISSDGNVTSSKITCWKLVVTLWKGYCSLIFA